MARALAQRRIAALVPVYRMLPEAEEAIERQPRVVRARIRLACHAHAPDVARRLVRETCPRWQVEAELQQIAELVVSELVDNVVRHAGTAAALTVQRGPGGLQIGVRDTGSPDGFTRSGGSAQGGRGRGLDLIARLSRNWGVQRHPIGKTIWAEIADPPARC
jgi:anti-sigma regulatory factor (Ser/Thr protein kinase)